MKLNNKRFYYILLSVLFSNFFFVNKTMCVTVSLSNVRVNGAIHQSVEKLNVNGQQLKFEEEGRPVYGVHKSFISSHSKARQNSKVKSVDDGPLRVSGNLMNYPNPFRLKDGTMIGYELTTVPDPGVDFYLYNMLGHQIFHKFIEKGNEGAKKGYNRIQFSNSDLNGYQLATTIYFYYISYENKVIGEGQMAILP